MNKVTILGSGTSTGVPILGCKCKVCQSTDIRNRRLRTSILIESQQQKKIIVDTTPDLRTQLIRENVKSLDAAILTHDHADHLHGIDDLRPFTFDKNLKIHTNLHTATNITARFPYIFQREKVFQNKPILGGGIPNLELSIVGPGNFQITDEEIDFFEVPHGLINTLGLIHSKFAYITDCNEIPENILEKLKGCHLDLLIIDCLRYERHSTHLYLEKTLNYIEKIAPLLTVLTHLGHEMEYVDLSTRLRRQGAKNIIPAFDGQCFYYS